MHLNTWYCYINTCTHPFPAFKLVFWKRWIDLNDNVVSNIHKTWIAYDLSSKLSPYLIGLKSEVSYLWDCIEICIECLGSTQIQPRHTVELVKSYISFAIPNTKECFVNMCMTKTESSRNVRKQQLTLWMLIMFYDWSE